MHREEATHNLPIVFSLDAGFIHIHDAVIFIIKFLVACHKPLPSLYGLHFY